MKNNAPHISVLYRKVLAGLAVKPGYCYIDATIGAGGHATGILEASTPSGRLLALDADPSALEISRQRLAPFKNRVIFHHTNFEHLALWARKSGFDAVDGVLFDLGVSSMMLDRPERGFSFQQQGPLDMRFDPTLEYTAADLVNTLSERDLANIIFRYGEEPSSRSIARAIVAARPIFATTELAAVVSQAIRRKGKTHPATRTFQAIRIAVNDELQKLEQGLQAALTVLKPGGRLAVITFHSLEDRIVKTFFSQEARDCICPIETMICTCGHLASLEIITKKPIRPDSQEISSNPRSRSAKLRIAAKRGR